MTTYEIYCSLKKEKGVTDADVSKATGIGKSTFSDWKSGRSKPKTEKMTKIADFFDVPYSFLAGITKDRSNARKTQDKRILDGTGQVLEKLELGKSLIKADDIKIVELDDDTTELISDGFRYRIVTSDAGTGKSNFIKDTVEKMKQLAKACDNANQTAILSEILTEDEQKLIKLYRQGEYREIVNMMIEKIQKGVNYG